MCEAVLYSSVPGIVYDANTELFVGCVIDVFERAVWMLFV